MGKIMGLISGSNPYLLAGILAIGIAMGGYVTYKIQRGNVMKLELVISQANTKALTELAIAKDRVAVAEKQTRQKNEEIDRANEENTKITNSYNEQLADALRLRDPNYSHNSNSVSGDSNTPINPENGKGEGILSEKLARLLRSETARADKITVDYNTLLEFVKDNNCGIVK
jgi:hypothetical protein